VPGPRARALFRYNPPMPSPLDNLLDYFKDRLKADAGGLSGVALSLAAAAMHRHAPRVVVFTPGPEVAEMILLDLEALLPGTTALISPLLDDNSPDKPAAWVDLLARLQEGNCILLAPAPTLLTAVPSPSAIAGSNLSIRPGRQTGLKALIQQLADAGYERTEQVDTQGQFARRGGIVDVFPTSRTTPVRIEFFGDEVESVRAFDPATQRSFETLVDGVAFSLAPLSAGDDAGLLDYLHDFQALAVDPARVIERVNTLLSFTEDPARHKRGNAIIELVQAPATRRIGETLDAPALTCVKPINLGDAYEGIAKLVHSLHDGGHRVLMFCGRDNELGQAREGLSGHGATESSQLVLLPGDIEGGRVLPDAKVAVLSVHELLGRGHRRLFADQPERDQMREVMDEFLDLEPGDYVVHLQHGIARFEGMQTIDRQGKPSEVLTLEFAEGTRLHVPATNADVVQRFVGLRGESPPLSKLNTAAWSERKLRAQHSVLKLATEMLEIQALRAQEAGHSCSPDGPELAEYEAACPFRDTPDQATSSVAIKRDMEKRKPMDRLLCGDVGYGKTELAMRAAFKMVVEGKQVAVLVPTTVLAQQHFLSFSERMRAFPVNIALLSRFRTAAQQRETIEKLAEGKVDIVIGTHRLLSNDVQFKDLGLVVIDEEQRFGVEHKEKLKQMRRTVDLLTLSATPIPRTLHQSLLGLRDISNLTTPPLNRLPVITKLMHWNDRELKDAITHELTRDGQVYFVHNRVFDIDLIAEKIQALVPDARVEVGHGQMPEGKLEDVMLRFMAREIDVLVCTTIIESGIDVRSANTIIIDHAHRHGLSDLHQLRGRVGRHVHQAYCYLLAPENVPLSDVAAKRLRAILQYQQLGSGFKIAMRDLEMRGAGNLLGAEQSGHISSIGYDLYCRLLDRAVKKMQHKEVPPEVDTQLDLGLDLQLPRNYIRSQKQRLEVYRKLARVSSDEGQKRLRDELSDRFGDPPAAVDRMLTAALVRARLAKLGVVSVSRASDHLKLRVLSAQSTRQRLEPVSTSFRVLDETTLALPLRKGLESPQDQMRFLSNMLSALEAKSKATSAAV
jgi:transcription-repair coupling factor (superfamily II helicase)